MSVTVLLVHVLWENNDAFPGIQTRMHTEHIKKHVQYRAYTLSVVHKTQEFSRISQGQMFQSSETYLCHKNVNQVCCITGMPPNLNNSLFYDVIKCHGALIPSVRLHNVQPAGVGVFKGVAYSVWMSQ